MLVNLLYEISLLLLAILALPNFLYQWIVKKKYQKSFRSRLGLQFPEIDPLEREVVWIHAVSVGETLAVAPLAKRLKEEKPNSLLIVSTTSETGQAEARRSLPFADHFVFLPFDFKWIIAPIIKQVKPRLLILCESDFWLNFMKAAKEAGAQVVLVNGKMSLRSGQRFQWFPWFSRHLFGLIDHFFIQTADYDNRFAALGIETSKRTVTGNMKFDVNHPLLSEADREDLCQQLGLQKGDLVLAVGSCHDPEEQLVLDALNPLWEAFPNLKVIFVPRHPERFNTVYQILEKQPLPSGRFSKAPLDPTTRLILIDAMGLLRKCYQLVDVALVAGSYTSKVGGHNITEPCWYGVPVLYGPHMHTKKELVSLMQSYGAGMQVQPQDLSNAFKKLLSDTQERDRLGKKGLKLVSEAHGATEKTWQGIQTVLAEKKLQKNLQ